MEDKDSNRLQVLKSHIEGILSLIRASDNFEHRRMLLRELRPLLDEVDRIELAENTPPRLKGPTDRPG